MFVKGNEVAVKRGIVGCGEAQAVFGIEAVFLVFSPRANVAGAKDVRKREAVPHGAADDRIRVVLRQNRAEHVERTDVGRCLAASVRVYHGTNVELIAIDDHVVAHEINIRFVGGAIRGEILVPAGIAFDLAFALLSEEPLRHLCLCRFLVYCFPALGGSRRDAMRPSTFLFLTMNSIPNPALKPQCDICSGVAACRGRSTRR